MKFVMHLEPHKPKNPERACFECVLQHGPMCLDRSYCEFKTTGMTWKKSASITTAEPGLANTEGCQHWYNKNKCIHCGKVFNG